MRYRKQSEHFRRYRRGPKLINCGIHYHSVIRKNPRILSKDLSGKERYIHYGFIDVPKNEKGKGREVLIVKPSSKFLELYRDNKLKINNMLTPELVSKFKESGTDDWGYHFYISPYSKSPMKKMALGTFTEGSDKKGFMAIWPGGIHKEVLAHELAHKRQSLAGKFRSLPEKILESAADKYVRRVHYHPKSIPQEVRIVEEKLPSKEVELLRLEKSKLFGQLKELEKKELSRPYSRFVSQKPRYMSWGDSGIIRGLKPVVKR